MEFVPIVSLEGLNNKNRRKEIINSIRSASETWGFFQLVNHGVPSMVMEKMMNGTRSVFEQDREVRKKYFNTPTIKIHGWNGALAAVFKGGPNLNPHQLPETCRDIFFEYTNYATSLAHTLFELLSESLGLESKYLESIADGSKCVSSVMNYCPKCPERALTQHTKSHCDPGFLSIILNNGVSNPQVLHQNHWVDVPIVPGSLLINIGHLLEIATNGKYKGAYHRLIANSDKLRMAMAILFRPAEPFTLGPIKELLSKDNPPKYFEKPMKDYLREIYSTEASVKVATIDDLKTQRGTSCSSASAFC